MRALLCRIRRAFSSGTFIEHYFSSKGFRLSISLLISLVPNIVYLVFNFVSGIRYGSLAFTAVSLYYALHVYIRFTILKLSDVKDAPRLIAASRKGGVLLLLADIVIAPMLIFGTFADAHLPYGSALLVFLSVYALYTLVSAAVGIIKDRRAGLPLRRAAYSVRLASGAMSLFNLVSALASTYGRDWLSLRVALVTLGAAVSALVLYLSLTMIFLPQRKGAKI